MPWTPKQFYNGKSIPGIGYGTWKMGQGEDVTTNVASALSAGFRHIDVAQAYRNEKLAGAAIAASGLQRDDIFITTKYSGFEEIEPSFKHSLEYLGVDYLDCYLIHDTVLDTMPDRPKMLAVWRKMEEFHAQGLVRSIGVSNFAVGDLEFILANCTVKPVTNQIELHPYKLAEQLPILEFCARHGIVVEAYSPLSPIVVQPNGPVDAPVAAIAARLGATPDQVLLSWARAKDAVVLTSSKKEARIAGYLKAGDFELTPEDVAAIDEAGLKGWDEKKTE